MPLQSMSVDRITQVFKRPTEEIVSEIERDTPSLNLYRFGGFDVCQVGLDSFRETLDSIALSLSFETTSLAMLPGNRVLHWRWFQHLVLTGGEPFPAISCQSFGYFDSDHDLSESIGVSDTELTRGKRHKSAREINAALEWIDRGTTIAEVSQRTGIGLSTLKRACRRRRDGGGQIAADQWSRSSLTLMAFDDEGEKVVPLSDADVRQVAELLRAGIHYRDVADMFDLCARDVRLLGITPTNEKQ